MKQLLTILPLVLILCFTVGCQDKEAMAEIERQNKAVVEHLFKELNKGNSEIIEELYAVDSSSFSPSASLKPISREEATEITKEFFHAFPDLTHNLEESIVVEDKVIIRFTAQGTHKGEFLGIPATGKKIVFSAITILRFEDGKVIEERQEVDMLGFFQQLGMELKSKETEKLILNH